MSSSQNSTSITDENAAVVLIELVVRDLGPARELSIVFGSGMTALTGETGAGKTILTEAIKLLCGGRSDSTMVRSGASEACVEGRFVGVGNEFVVRRMVPAAGRSRAYIDGNLASLGELASTVGVLVDLHGQNGHHSLTRAGAQRQALDDSGGIDTSGLKALRSELTDIDHRIGELGGDSKARNREIDLYRYQLDELAAAAIEDPFEDEQLQRRERLLANATDHRVAAAAAAEHLGSEGASHTVARAIAGLDGIEPFAEQVQRLRSAEVELSEVARELSGLAETIEDDPEALVAAQQRREVLSGLRRKYGDTLAEVIEYRDETNKRLVELESHGERAAMLETSRAEVDTQLRRLETKVGSARRKAAGPMAAALQARVRTLALPNALIKVHVGDTDPGDDIEIRVAMNSGSQPGALAKVASGGELSRTMLALQLEASAGPPIMIFDEVDAGVGGQAANSIADALSGLASSHQILVVTHLAQVAAAADHQVCVTKNDDGETTEVEVAAIRGEDRVVEIARMLSGDSGSKSARAHAQELIAKSP